MVVHGYTIEWRPYPGKRTWALCRQKYTPAAGRWVDMPPSQLFINWAAADKAGQKWLKKDGR